MNDKKITEGTLVPLGVVGSILVAVVMCTLWIASVNSTANDAKSDISEMKQSYGDEIKEINERLSRMEGYMARIANSHR